jgi:tetratricopeptide (TPR) repeat protein
LGDSFTAGVGAPYGKNYPRCLEAMLNSIGSKRKFRVINTGRSSYNTTQILSELQDALKGGIKPDLVTLLGGLANYWNYQGYHIYLKGENISSVIKDYLYRIRIYKLGKLLFLNIKDKFKSKLFARQVADRLFLNSSVPNVKKMTNDKLKERQNLIKEPDSSAGYCRKGFFYKDQRQLNEAAECFKKSIELDPNNSTGYLGMGVICHEWYQYDEAIEWFKKSIKVNPNNSKNYSAMGYALIGKRQYDEALEYFKECIRLNPNDNSGYFGIGIFYKDKMDYERAIPYFQKAIRLEPAFIYGYTELFNIYSRLGRHKEGLDFLNELAKNNSVPEGFIDMLNNRKEQDINKEITKWMVSDIEKIIKICKENGIKIFLLDYPNPLHLRESELFYNIAKTNSVTFISNSQESVNLTKAGEKIEDYCPPGEHCNANGYAFMARNILDKIIEENIFDFDRK